MWTKVARSTDIAPGEARVARVRYREFALYNVDGRIYATGNRCPHQGGSLADGFLEGPRIVCPLHGWAFDVRTGAAAYPAQPGRVKVYPVKVENGEVWVDLPEEEET